MYVAGEFASLMAFVRIRSLNFQFSIGDSMASTVGTPKGSSALRRQQSLTALFSQLPGRCRFSHRYIPGDWLLCFAPLIAPKDPAEQSLLNRRAAPNSEFILGADEFGRDILSRLIYGARVSLGISVSSVGFGLIIGSLLGVIAGFWGRGD